jgi:hypothetical protein
VEIQRGVAEREPEVPEERRIRFRIGINLGDVIVEGDDIFGDGVNVAARLELASPTSANSSGHHRYRQCRTDAASLISLYRSLSLQARVHAVYRYDSRSVIPTRRGSPVPTRGIYNHYEQFYWDRRRYPGGRSGEVLSLLEKGLGCTLA